MIWMALMGPTRVFAILFSLLIISSCDSVVQENNSLFEICQEIEGHNCSVSREIGYLGNSELYQITVELTGVETLRDCDNYEYITSFAAKHYWDNNDCTAVGSLVVVINNPDTTFRHKYFPEDLKVLDESYSMIANFMEVVSKREYDRINDFLDERAKVSEADSVIIEGCRRLDSIYGRQESFNIKGFHFDKIKDSEEKVIVFWVDALMTRDAVASYSLILTNSGKSILQVGSQVYVSNSEAELSH